jgi:hypothetical protein
VTTQAPPHYKNQVAALRLYMTQREPGNNHVKLIVALIAGGTVLYGILSLTILRSNLSAKGIPRH